jgi:hypothetical protein
LHKFYAEAHNSAIVISVITLIALTLLNLKGKEGEVALAEFKVIRKKSNLKIRLMGIKSGLHQQVNLVHLKKGQ